MGANIGHVKWSDRLKIELLRLSTLLLEYSSHNFKRYKNELIIFAWNFKKSEDSIIKYWACLNAARFLTYMEVCVCVIVPCVS